MSWQHHISLHMHIILLISTGLCATCTSLCIILNCNNQGSVLWSENGETEIRFDGTAASERSDALISVVQRHLCWFTLNTITCFHEDRSNYSFVTSPIVEVTTGCFINCHHIISPDLGGFILHWHYSSSCSLKLSHLCYMSVRCFSWVSSCPSSLIGSTSDDVKSVSDGFGSGSSSSSSTSCSECSYFSSTTMSS